MKRKAYLLIFLLAPSFIYSQKISQWRGLNRNGIYKEEKLLKKWEKLPEIVWKYDSLGKGFTSAAVVEDKVFITGTVDSLGCIFAFNHKGEMLWKKIYGEEWFVNYPGVRSTPLIYHDKGYLLSGVGQLICFKTENGDIVWQNNIYEKYGGDTLKFGIAENLVIDDSILFCTPGGKEKNILALNKDTGKLIWYNSGKGEKASYCSPAVINHNGRKYFITFTTKSLISVDIQTSKTAWTIEYETLFASHANSFLYRDGCLFVIAGQGPGAVKLKISDDGKSVEQVWSHTDINPTFGDAILIDDDLYVSSAAKRKWYCLDWETGKEKYSDKLGGEGAGIYSDEMLYCYFFNGYVGLIKPEKEKFNVVSSFRVPGKKKDHWAYPVIHNGRLYIRYENSLWVFNIAE